MKYPAPCEPDTRVRFSFLRLNQEKVTGTGVFCARKGGAPGPDEFVTWVVYGDDRRHYCLIPAAGDTVEPIDV